MYCNVRINGERISLDDVDALNRLRADLLAAVHAGGAFVRVGPGGGTELLVTAASVVRIDLLPDSVLEDDWTGADDLTFIDFDTL